MTERQKGRFPGKSKGSYNAWLLMARKEDASTRKQRERVAENVTPTPPFR